MCSSDLIELDINEDNAYAFSKRLIQDSIRPKDYGKFLTLRIFGCFGSGEPQHRLLKRYMNTASTFEIENNRLFDYFSVQDFYNVLRYVVNCVKDGRSLEVTHNNTIDCVYKQKITLDRFLELYCDINNYEKRYVVKSTTNNHYTGDSKYLDHLQENGDLTLYGLAHGLKVYNE